MSFEDSELSQELVRLSNDDILERLRERAGSNTGDRQREEKKRCLVFRLANNWFAVEAGVVREISRPGNITRVPLTKSYVLGVVNLRGNVTAVLDIRDIIGLDRNKIDSNTRIIVVAAENLEAGFLADAVSEVVEVAQSSIEPPLLTTGRDLAAYIQGNFTLGDKVVSILNPANLLLNLKV